MKKSKEITIILASKSLGRKKLLNQINLEYTAIPADIEEIHPKNMSIKEIVQYLAEKKAIFVSKRYPDAYVIGADSLCLLNGKIIGKPQSKKHAFDLLKNLQENDHYLYSGLAVVTPNTNQVITDYDKTVVSFKKLDSDEINKYLELFDFRNFAAAYQLEGLGSLFIRKINGCPSTVIGLSLPKLFQAFKKAGINLLNQINEF